MRSLIQHKVSTQRLAKPDTFYEAKGIITGICLDVKTLRRTRFFPFGTSYLFVVVYPEYTSVSMTIATEDPVTHEKNSHYCIDNLTWY